MFAASKVWLYDVVRPNLQQDVSRAERRVALCVRLIFEYCRIGEYNCSHQEFNVRTLPTVYRVPSRSRVAVTEDHDHAWRCVWWWCIKVTQTANNLGVATALPNPVTLNINRTQKLMFHLKCLPKEQEGKLIEHVGGCLDSFEYVSSPSFR